MSGSGQEITVVTSVDGADGMLETAALIACSMSSEVVVGLLVWFSDGKAPVPPGVCVAPTRAAAMSGASSPMTSCVIN